MKYKKDEIYDLEGERVKALDFLDNFVYYEVLKKGERFYCGYGYWEKNAKHIAVKVQDVEADMVNHPQHYNKGKYEVIDVIEDWGLGFCLGNAIKYIARCEHKGNRKQDLEKAIFYLKRELERENSDEK